MKYIPLCVAACIAILFSAPSPAVAAFIGPEFTVSTAAGTQYQASVIYDPAAQRFLVVWADTRAGSLDIYGQFISSTGTLLGGEFSISTAAGSQWEPAIAFDPADQRFLVAWQDDREGDLAEDIYGQMISSTGALVGDEITICSAAMFQYFPSVAYDPLSRRFLVVWEDYRSYSSYDIYGQFVGATGTVIGGNFPISMGGGEQWDPFVAYDPLAQGFLVAWSDFQSGGRWGIYGRRVGPDGTLIGLDIPISASVTEQWDEKWDPSAAFDPASERVLVVWKNPWGISGQVLGRDGTPIGGNFSMSTASGARERPSVVYDPVDGQFLVAWQELGYMSTTFFDIHGRFVGPDGTLVGRDIPISTAANMQQRPSTAYGPAARRYLATWEDYRGASIDVYGVPLKVGGIAAGELPSGTAGVPYEARLQAAGGTPPYTWTLASGAPPTGITLAAATGELSGTPVTFGAFAFEVRVTEAEGFTDGVRQNITVMIPPPPTSQGCGCTLGPGTASMLLSSLILTLVPLVYVLWTLRRKKRARRSPGFG